MWQKLKAVKRIYDNLDRFGSLGANFPSLERLLGWSKQIEALIQNAEQQKLLLQRLRRLDSSILELQQAGTQLEGMEALIGMEERIQDLRQAIERLDYSVMSIPCPTLPLFNSAVSRSPRLGCSYNLMNNFYNLVNSLRRTGFEADLVLWRGYDYTLTDDPRWEHEQVCVESFDNFRLQDLKSAQPEFVREIPVTASSTSSQVNTPFPRHLLDVAGYLNINVDGIISTLRDYDILLVSGQGIAIAPFVGKPYVTFAYGADLYESPFGDDRYSRLIRSGWQRANANVLSGGHFYRFARLLGLENCTYIPILVDTDRYMPSGQRSLREHLLARHKCDHLFIAPARHDWKWKGNDRMIYAAGELRKRTSKSFNVLLANWGNDLEKSRSLIKKLDLEQICVFVGAMSKPVLHDYIQAADVVLDQFTLGEYGTLTLESMSLEKPVMLYYKGSTPPPIINAFSAEEIADQMLVSLNHPGDMQALGVKARKWVIEHHGPSATVPKFQQVIKAVVNGQEIPQFSRIM